MLALVLCFFASCQQDDPPINYSLEDAIGEEIPRRKFIWPYPDKEIDWKKLADSYNKEDDAYDVIVDIDLGEFDDIDNMGTNIIKYLKIHNYGKIKYCLYSVTSDYKRVYGILIPLIPTASFHDEELLTGWDINDYASVFFSISFSLLNSPKRGWDYLYARNSFYNIEMQSDINYIESFNPRFTTWGDKKKIEITPKAREAMVVVMKMLRQETLNEREQLIAAKYQSQVQKVLKQKNNKY